MKTRHRIAKWVVQKFDAYRDASKLGGYAVKPERPKMGFVRMPDGLSDSKILAVLKRAGLIEAASGVRLDWLSDGSFNILDGDFPLYQVNRMTTRSELKARRRQEHGSASWEMRSEGWE